FLPGPAATQLKPRHLNPPGHTPDQSPPKVASAFVFQIVSVSQNHIFPPSLLVGNKDFCNGSRVVEDFHQHVPVVDEPEHLPVIPDLFPLDVHAISPNYLIHSFSSCSRVFPLVSGTHLSTKMAERTLITP